MDYYNWTKDGVLIDSSDLKFQQFMRITDSVLVTPQVILSSSNRSYFQGTFRCTVRDGLGRTSYSTINFNSKNPKYKVLIITAIVYTLAYSFMYGRYIILQANESI